MLRWALICTALSVVAAAPAAALTPVGEVRQVGAESIVQTQTGLALSVAAPSVAWDPVRERFLVTWRRNARPVEEPSTWGRFVGSDGVPRGEAFRVSDGAGAALVHNPVTGGFGLIAADELVRLDVDGRVLGRDRFAGEQGPGTLEAPGASAVAVDEVTGAYMVAWLYVPQRDSRMLLVRSVGAAGGLGAAAIPVVPFSGGPITEASTSPAVAWNPADGGFLVSWSSQDGIWDRRLTASGTPVGDVVRITGMDRSSQVTLARLPRDNGFMSVWTAGVAEPEWQVDVFARRLLPTGVPVADDAHRVTHVTSYDGGRGWVIGSLSAVTGTRADELLVTADVEHQTAPLETAEQTFAQALTADGAETGPDDLPVGGGADAGVGDKYSAIAYAPAANRYLVAWLSVPNRPEPLRFTVHARAFDAGPQVETAPPVATAGICRDLPPTGAAQGTPGRVTLTARQARITLRTSRAALRRAQAAERWLDAGIQGRDLCGGAIGPSKFRSGTAAGNWPDDVTRGEPHPRPVTIAPAGPEPARLRLSTARLARDQQTARDAITLVGALEARLDAGLTGGDIADRAVAETNLLAGFHPLRVPVEPVDAPTSVAHGISVGGAAPVRVTLAQMRINQRIARAALLRADALIRRLEDGIGPDEIRDGTLTAADLAPGVQGAVAP